MLLQRAGSNKRTVKMVSLGYYLLIYLATSMFAQLTQAATEDFCLGDDFTASCGPEEVVVMETSEYGRMEAGRCIPEESANFGCANDVLFLTDRWCSGRKRCSFYVPPKEMIEANVACTRGFLAYVRAAYTCMKVAGLASDGCLASSPNILRSSSGAISNQVTEDTGCGSAISPWVMQADPGQIIEISLLDFKALDRTGNQSVETCADVYGFVVEKTLNINQTICGLKQRDGVIYRSKTNTVEIYLIQNTGINFILQYTTSGCGDAEPPAHAWYKRSGNEAVIGCETSDKEWRLTCVGNTWEGNVDNCSVPVVKTDANTQIGSVEFELSTVVILAAIIGGTIIIAVSIIVFGVVYIQKHKERQESEHSVTQPRRQESRGTSSTHAHYRPVLSTIAEKHDETVQLNTKSPAQKSPTKTDEPLIHIWEMPLPDPMNASKECTIHQTELRVDINKAETNDKQHDITNSKDAAKSDVTSSYSAQTGHNYNIPDHK